MYATCKRCGAPLYRAGTNWQWTATNNNNGRSSGGCSTGFENFSSHLV